MKPDLQALLAYWQKALRLLDWRVKIGYVANLVSPGGQPVLGQCWPLVDNKTAVIEIRDPATPVGSGITPPIEEIVVHELAHLHFAPFGTTEPTAVAAEENAVWAFSEALVKEKGTPRGAALARAMAARFSIPTAAAVMRRKSMGVDPVIIAALRAACTAEDPKAAIEALLAELEKAGGGEPEAPAPPSMAPPSMAAPDEKPPMAARHHPARPPVVVSQVLTIADVQRVMREESAKVALIGAARSARVGVTDKLAERLSVMPLAEARDFVEALEIKPTVVAPVSRSAVAVGAAAATELHEQAEPTPEEKDTIRKMNEAFGHRPTPAEVPGTWDLSRLKTAKAATTRQPTPPALTK